MERPIYRISLEPLMKLEIKEINKVLSTFIFGFLELF